MLTGHLLEASPRCLYAIEIDRERFSADLEPLAFAHPNLEIIWCDALAFDYRVFFDVPPEKIVANIPYQITTELLWKLLEEAAPAGAASFLLMVQAEAADRISARPGARQSNPLSVTLALMGSVDLVKNVPPEVFRPRPKVQSTIVQIQLDKPRFFEEKKNWRHFIETAYRQRRKTLLNNLFKGLHLEREMIMSWFRKLGVGPKQRAEEIDPDIWNLLYEEWSKMRRAKP